MLLFSAFLSFMIVYGGLAAGNLVIGVGKIKPIDRVAFPSPI